MGKVEKCGGDLHYENIAGVFRVYREVGRLRIYSYRCAKCGMMGENNGKANRCSLPARRTK